MAKKRFHDSDSSSDHVRKQESRDFSMLSEDYNAPANLPQDVKYHAWPKSGRYAEYNLDDTIRGIDDQLDADGSVMKRNRSRNKY